MCLDVFEGLKMNSVKHNYIAEQVQWSFCRLSNIKLVALFAGETALNIVIKRVTEGLQGIEKQEATTEK